MWYASRGFCEQRPPADRSWGAHIKGRCSRTGNRAKDYVIKNNIFVDGKDRLLQFPPQEFEEIVSLCRLLETEYGKREQYREDILKNLLECLVALVLRKLPPTEQTETAETGDIKRAVLYIQRHFKESPALSEVAKTVNLHPNYFSQKFREETGESFTAYITEQKISYAKKLLLCSDLTVTEICFASGFCSLSNFMKVFKKAVGVPPLQYVQQQKTVCR